MKILLVQLESQIDDLPLLIILDKLLLVGVDIIVFIIVGELGKISALFKQ